MEKNLISIDQMLDNYYVLLTNYDLYYACSDYDYIDKLVKKIKQGEMSIDEKYNEIRNNKEYYDENKIFLYSLRNSMFIVEDLRKEITQRIEKINSLPVTALNEKVLESTKLQELQKTLKLQKEKLEKMKEIASKIDIYAATERFESEKVGDMWLEILYSKELVGSKKINETKKLARFEKFLLDVDSINVGESTGTDLLYSMIVTPEMMDIFPTPELNNETFNYSVDKFLMTVAGKTKQEIEEIKQDREKMYDIYFKDKENLFVKHGLLDTIRESIKYADIDMFILRTGYRLEEKLENQKVSAEELQVSQEFLKLVAKYCRDNKISSRYQISIVQDMNNIGQKEYLQYSINEINNCLKKIYKDKYYSDSKQETLRQLVSAERIHLEDMPDEIVQMIYSEDDAKQLLFSNFENYMYITKALDLDKEAILSIAKQQGMDNSQVLGILLENGIIESNDIAQLYIESKVSYETLEKLLEETNLQADFEKLKEYYEESRKSAKTMEKSLKYEEFCELISERNFEEFSEEFMASFAENYDQKNRTKYIKQLEHFYDTGLLSMSSIVNWEDENIVAQFLKDEIISYDDLENFKAENLISEELFKKLYSEKIMQQDMDYDTRIKELKSGNIDEDYIIKVYALNLISSNDLEELIEMGLVNRNNKILKKMRLEDFEKNANIILGDLSALTKKRDVYAGDGFSTYIPGDDKNKKPTTIIDPNDRETLLRMLKAKKATAKMEKENPFYNYEFYVIPDESGDLGENSVVIAERYYDDKISEATFSINNATYFFRYKDLLYLSNLRKSEMLKERKNVVFKAHHVLGNDKKVGHWGSSVVFAIAKTMLGKDLKELNKKDFRKTVLDKLLEVYTLDELAEAWNFAGEIDRGDYNADIVEER